jgi:hypothetical protein
LGRCDLHRKSFGEKLDALLQLEIELDASSINQ